MAASSGGSNAHRSRLIELHRLYDWICSAESASRQRNERLLERVNETDARASVLARQTERLRSLIRRTSSVSGSASFRLEELMRRERILAVTEPIWTESEPITDEASSPRLESTYHDWVLEPGNSKSHTLALPRSVADSSTQTAEITPPPPLRATNPAEGSTRSMERHSDAHSSDGGGNVEGVVVGRDFPVFDIDDSLRGKGVANVSPDRTDTTPPGSVISLVGRDLPAVTPDDGRDSSPSAEPEAILKNDAGNSAAQFSTKHSADSSSSSDEDYDPFFNFNFTNRKTSAPPKMNDSELFLTRNKLGEMTLIDSVTAGHTPSEISGGDQDDVSDFFDN